MWKAKNFEPTCSPHQSIPKSTPNIYPFMGVGCRNLCRELTDVSPSYVAGCPLQAQTRQKDAENVRQVSVWGSRKSHKFCHVVSCFKFRVFFVQLCSTCSAWTQSSGQRVQLCSWFTPCGEQTLRLVAASTCCFKIPIGYFSDRSKGRQSYCCVQPIALKERWTVEPLSPWKNGCDFAHSICLVFLLLFYVVFSP